MARPPPRPDTMRQPHPPLRAAAICSKAAVVVPSATAAFLCLGPDGLIQALISPHIPVQKQSEERRALKKVKKRALLLVNPKARDWDIAAADLILAEAGGVATDHLGAPFDYNLPAAKQKSLVCAGPAMHPLLIDRVGHIEIRKPIQP